MGVPVIFFGQCLVDAVVKVLVMREDDVTTDIVELFFDQRRDRTNVYARSD